VKTDLHHHAAPAEAVTQASSARSLPTHSYATSTPTPSSVSAISAAPMPPSLGSTQRRPRSCASIEARRAALGSLTYTRAAPASLAAMAVSTPIGPPPATSTVASGFTPPRSTAEMATAAGSIIAPCATSTS